MDEPLEGTETPTDQALTKTTKKGRRYKRRSVVDQQIRAVSSLSPDKLVEYARIHQKDNPAFLAEEALVYFIQQFHQKGNDSARDQLIAELIGRCSKIIYSHVRGLSISLEDAANEVIEELFRRIVAPMKKKTLRQSDLKKEKTIERRSKRNQLVDHKAASIELIIEFRNLSKFTWNLIQSHNSQPPWLTWPGKVPTPSRIAWIGRVQAYWQSYLKFPLCHNGRDKSAYNLL